MFSILDLATAALAINDAASADSVESVIADTHRFAHKETQSLLRDLVLAMRQFPALRYSLQDVRGAGRTLLFCAPVDPSGKQRLVLEVEHWTYASGATRQTYSLSLLQATSNTRPDAISCADAFHYTVEGAEYFPIDQRDLAVRAFHQRLTGNDPRRATGLAPDFRTLMA